MINRHIERMRRNPVKSPAFVTFADAHEQLLSQHKADRGTRIA